MATATKPVLLDETGKQMVAALQGINVALTTESLKNIIDTVGLSHNGIYRGKNLGTITSANIGTFLSEHKVAEGLFTDLYLGDYFVIQDGTYNKEWEIAGFDMYLNKGDTAFTKHHLVLFPRANLLTAKMNETNTSEGGYMGSDMYKTVIPAVVANLNKALGARMLTRRALLTNSVLATAPSMAGGNMMGTSNGVEWVEVIAVLPSEVAIYGATVGSSSMIDVGEDCEKMPVFNFHNHTVPNRETFWLKAVGSSAGFCFAFAVGYASTAAASASLGVRPLICVG